MEEEKVDDIIKETEEEVERLSEELARQVMGLTEEEMAEYVKATS